MPSAYGVFAATGCVVAVLWLKARREQLGLSENAFWAATWSMVLGATVGAKALFVVLGWEHYARGELRLWADFQVGFVFFGGLLGATAAGAAFAWLRGLSFLRGADYVAVAAPLGHAIGRVGCFVNGCCAGHPPHPVQLYEAAGLLLIAGSARSLLGRIEAGRLGQGSAFWSYLALYGVLRVMLDPLRADGRPERLLGLSIQQGLALAAVAVALVAVARSWRQLSRVALLAAVVLGAAACATVVPTPPATEEGAGDPEAAWARVLREHVLDDGRIDFVGLRRDSRDLDRYVAWVAAHGPRTTPARFPTRQAQLAYYINAYNALAMRLIVATPRRPEQQIRFFVLTGVEVDGERRSLYQLENAVVRPLGEPRVHFALNCMVRGCPRLPREPFDADRLEAQLERETRRFLNEPRNVQLDPPLGVVRLSSILRFYTKDFLAQAPSLVAYVNRYREEPLPGAVEVEFIPYDWTLHQR